MQQMQELQKAQNTKNDYVDDILKQQNLHMKIIKPYFSATRPYTKRELFQGKTLKPVS